MTSIVTISIRPAMAADTRALQELIDEVYRNAKWLPASANRSLDVTHTTKGERCMVAANRAGRIVGMVSVYEADAFIHHLYVAASTRRLGVGAAMLDSLKSWLVYPWRLKCVCANTDALAFYAAHGWVVEEEGEGEEGPYLQLLKHANERS
jgi:GNAT superfamily N-acetyltransferase